jgi:hypothetical protein
MQIECEFTCYNMHSSKIVFQRRKNLFQGKKSRNEIEGMRKECLNFEV